VNSSSSDAFWSQLHLSKCRTPGRLKSVCCVSAMSAAAAAVAAVVAGKEAGWQTLQSWGPGQAASCCQPPAQQQQPAAAAAAVAAVAALPVLLLQPPGLVAAPFRLVPLLGV
jgi:hypothetical protein